MAEAGGGYPAAGIGRRRSWPEVVGDTNNGGGGFSSGGSEGTGGTVPVGGVNGQIGYVILRSTSGSYFAEGKYGTTPSNSVAGLGEIGGIKTPSAGSGGTGGSGGTVYVEGDLTRVHAYNGAYITEVEAIAQTDSWKQENQSIIYAQIGYSLVDIRKDTEDVEYTYRGITFTLHRPIVSSISARTATDLITELGTSYRTIDYSVYTTYGAMGIGSGGGCIEVSNGTLTVE